MPVTAATMTLLSSNAIIALIIIAVLGFLAFACWKIWNILRDFNGDRD